MLIQTFEPVFIDTNLEMHGNFRDTLLRECFQWILLDKKNCIFYLLFTCYSLWIFWRYLWFFFIKIQWNRTCSKRYSFSTPLEANQIIPTSDSILIHFKIKRIVWQTTILEISWWVIHMNYFIIQYFLIFCWTVIQFFRIYLQPFRKYSN